MFVHTLVSVVAVDKDNFLNAGFGTGVNRILNNRQVIQAQETFMHGFGSRQVAGRKPGNGQNDNFWSCKHDDAPC